MKHLKTFEKNIDTEQTLKSAVNYIQTQLGLTRKDGMLPIDYKNYSSSNFFTICLYFYRWVDREDLNKVYKFLENNNLRLIQGFNMSDMIEINIEISKYKIEKFAKLNDDMIKYNL